MNFDFGGNTNHEKQLLKRTQLLVDSLELGAGVTMEEMIAKVEEIRNARITKTPARLTPSLSGFSVCSEEGHYAICYHQELAGISLEVVILHELSHILKGHTDFLVPIAKGAVLTAINSGQDLQTLPGVLCRGENAPDPALEREVELLALCLRRKLISDEVQRDLDGVMQRWFGPD